MPDPAFAPAADAARESAESARPFRSLGVQHLAIGAPDKERLRHLWLDLLGFHVVDHLRNERENVDEDICRLNDDPHGVEIDLMQPLDRARKPSVHEPLHHLGLWVDDLPAAVNWLEQHGVRFTPGGIRRSDTGRDICFIHPKGKALFPIGGEGVLIELVQAPSVGAGRRCCLSVPSEKGKPTAPSGHRSFKRLGPTRGCRRRPAACLGSGAASRRCFRATTP